MANLIPTKTTFVLTPVDGAMDSEYTETGESNEPAWATAITTLDEWTELTATNTLSDVRPSPLPGGTTGHEAVMTAWNGAVIAPDVGDSGTMVFWGGGHADYYGNEVYYFDLSTLTWSRVTEPYAPQTMPDPDGDGIYPDGTPYVPHTYWYPVYRSVAREFVCGMRTYDNTGSAPMPRATRFSLDNLTWVCSTTNPNITNLVADCGCFYVPGRDELWWMRSDSMRFGRYNFGADSVTTTAGSGAYDAGPFCYVPTIDAVVFWPRNISSLKGVSLSALATTRTLSTTGTAPPSGATVTDGVSGAMMHWSAELGAIVYSPRRSSRIFTLTPPAGDWTADDWTWAERTVTNTVGTITGLNGQYGKFGLIEYGTKVFGIFNANHTGNPVAIRLQ